MPPGGLNIRTPDGILEQEARLQEHKRDAMVAWIAANKLNRIITSGGADPKIGIITARQVLSRHAPGARRSRHRRSALQRAGPAALQARLRLADRAQRACANSRAGSSLIIVVEEKRSLIEVQVREELYGAPNQPVCIGKKDEAGQLAVSRQRRARPQRHRDRDRRTAAQISSERSADARASPSSDDRRPRSPTSRRSPSARPISARAARTIARR